MGCTTLLSPMTHGSYNALTAHGLWESHIYTWTSNLNQVTMDSKKIICRVLVCIAVGELHETS